MQPAGGLLKTEHCTPPPGGRTLRTSTLTMHVPKALRYPHMCSNACTCTDITCYLFSILWPHSPLQSLGFRFSNLLCILQVLLLLPQEEKEIGKQQIKAEMLLCGVGRCIKRMLPACVSVNRGCCGQEAAAATLPVCPEGTQDGDKQAACCQITSLCSCPQLTLKGFRMEKNRILTLYN